MEGFTLSDLITSVLNQFITEADNVRSDFQERRMNIYLDDYVDQITELMKTQFATENYNVLYPMVAQYDNVLKKIIHLKAQTYKDVPKRAWSVGEDEDETYQQVVGMSNLDSECISLEKFAFVNNIAFMRIKVIGDQLVYEAIAPENISVEQDKKNPMEIHALIHRIVKNSTKGQFVSSYHVWTDGLSSLDDDTFPQGYFKVYREDDEFDDDTEKQPNPYIDPKTGRGIIPYVDMRTVRGVDYWCETMNDDLRIGTLQINVMESHFNNLMKWSGYRQLFITGDVDTKELQRQKSDVGAVIAVRSVAGQTSPTVQTEEMTTDPNNLLTAISRVKAILADNHGVSYSADSLSSGQRQTAEAMTINRQQLIDIRKGVLPLFREFEYKLAWYTVIIANTPLNMQGLGKSIDITGEFSIDYQEPKVVSDPREEFETDLLKVNAGIMSKADLMIKYNPDIKSEDQAIKALQHVKEIDQQINGAIGIENEITQAVAGINIAIPEGQTN